MQEVNVLRKRRSRFERDKDGGRVRYTGTKIEYAPYEWGERDEQERWRKRHRGKDIKIRKPQKKLQMAVENMKILHKGKSTYC